jgi:aminoglycoside phosphotransferase (APT) family kinase protein
MYVGGLLLTEDIEARISEYYGRLYPDREGLRISDVEDITSGWEARLLTYVVEYLEAGRTVREERAIRLFQGHQASQKAQGEYSLLSRLHEAGFPVPEVFHVEPEPSALGGPFIVMEYVRGRNLSEVLIDASKEEAERLMTEFTRIWVDLHRLEGSTIIPGFPEGDTGRYLDDLIAIAEEYIRNLGVGWLQPVIEWIQAHRGEVAPEGLCVIHQDYHTHNVMVRDDGRLVVLDWTSAIPGDYRADLAWTVLLMGTYGPQEVRDEILERYERVSGRETRDIEFFDVIASARRLLSVAASMSAGAEQMGMRPGAEEQMRESSGHLRKVYKLLRERTGIQLPQVEEFLDSL